MTRFRRQQKHHHRRDLFRRWSFVFPEESWRGCLQLILRLRKRVEPAAIKRRHHFGRNYCVYADSVGQQLSRPFASQRHDRTFRRRIPRCASLPRHSSLRTNIDDRTASPLQMRQGVVRHAVVMHQVALEGCHVFLGFPCSSPTLSLRPALLTSASRWPNSFNARNGLLAALSRPELTD